jgi:hypothetical protein
MEWESGRTDFQYYHPYLATHKIENTVIDYDLKNLEKALELEKADAVDEDGNVIVKKGK